MTRKKNKIITVLISSLTSLALVSSTAAVASANPIYDYALHVLNSRNECEQTLKRIRPTLIWGDCVTAPIGVTYLIGVRK
ncbi:hypothetical protein DWV92_07190 [Bifidobacterium pseudolongum]|uniref:Secreted protein n=1 Tax=Bifidobacterium pseudolongum TaxID=1694 RepID=A0A395XFJ1_9BIFI|nr:hypothetical protein DWV92_07190 [Bifidobacterium pseudolongum]